MRESLIVHGIDLLSVGVGSIPPGAAITVKPVWVTETVTFLDGRQATYRAEVRGAAVITLNPGDTFAVPLSVKQAVEAAAMNFEAVTITETLSDPSQARTWTGFLDGEPTFREVEGSERALFNYSFTIRQEG